MWVCETSMRDLPPLTSFSEKSIWIHVQERTDYGAGSHFLVQSTGDRPGVQERCACVATSPGQGAPVLSLGFRIIPASFYGKTPNILPKWLFEPFWNFKKQFDLKSSFQQKKTVKNTHDVVLSTGFQTFHQRTPPPRRGQMAQFHSSAGEAALASAARCRSWEADGWVKTSYDIWKVRPLRCIHDSDLMNVYIYIIIYISVYML